MLRNDIKSKFIDILKNHIYEDIDNHIFDDENTKINSLNIDSLDIMEILVEIEGEFNLTVPDEWLEKNENITLGEMIDYLFLNKGN